MKNNKYSDYKIFQIKAVGKRSDDKNIKSSFGLLLQFHITLNKFAVEMVKRLRRS